MTTPTYRLRTLSGAVAGLLICGSSQVTGQSAVSLNPMTSVDRESLRGFLERPLFVPARRLPPPETARIAPPPLATPPAPPPTLKLLGVIHGSRDIAIVRRDGEERPVILTTGDHVGVWAVTILPPTGIRIRNGARAFDYALFEKSSDSFPRAVDQEGESGDKR